MREDTNNNELEPCVINLTINFAKGCTIIISGGEVDVAGDKSVKGARSVIEGAKSIIEGARTSIEGASVASYSDGLPPNYPRVEVLEE
jgi:hypothetical protein